MQIFLTTTPTVIKGSDSLKIEAPTTLRAGAGELTTATYNIENFPGAAAAACMQ